MTQNEIPPRWYAVDKDGLATLCVNERDAVASAKIFSGEWPHNNPYRAVQLADAAELVAIKKDIEEYVGIASKQAGEILALESERDNALKEARAQARLLGMSAEREAALRSELDGAINHVPLLKAALAQAEGEVDRLRAALQLLLDALPSGTTHPAIKAARAALALQETENGRDQS